ncbi:MAG: hypothetical protein E6G72_12135 [Alphaproteobacteria bacterium]|nr:MAG: hypothetical protein E6G72_12135 [Alphaproteobacteria bacterium]
MVFVLYLAGLAVLIVVLALGLEFVQRRGAPAVSSPLRQEPVVAPTTPALTPTGGASPSLASGAASSAAPPPAPILARTGAVREIVLIVAVALLALIALGSDWVFYRQLDEMRAARRAWLAPQSARSDKAPAVALSDAGSPSVDRSIRDALNHCLATKPGDRTRVVYPNPAGANDRTTLSVKRELIDWDVLYGTKILVVPGCYAYRTGGQTHHSAFCFFYQHGFSNPNDWAICQGGNYAD